MSRFKKSEYRAERRAALKQARAQQEKCEGEMGLCPERKVPLCERCKRPFCENHLVYHLTQCRGMK